VLGLGCIALVLVLGPVNLKSPGNATRPSFPRSLVGNPRPGDFLDSDRGPYGTTWFCYNAYFEK